MPSFSAAVVTQTGTKKKVWVWANDLRGAFEMLTSRNYAILNVVERRPDFEKKARRLVIPGEDLKSFLDQLAVQLDASVPIDEALRSLLGELEEGPVRTLADGLLASIVKDGNISKAFAVFPRVFPPHICQMIEVGFATGRLAETFNDIAIGFEESEAVRAEAKKALHYPTIALTVSVLVAVFLLGFVMPMFGRVFADLGIRPPVLTRFYLELGSVLSSHYLMAILSCGVILSGVYALTRQSKFRTVFETMVSKAPIAGPIIQALAITRVAGAMKMMQKVGMSAQDGLQVACGLTGNSFYEKALKMAVASVEKGEGIGRSLEQTEAFPSLMCLTLQTGEETNRLENALGRVHAYYGRLAKQRIGKALQWIEPLVTVGLGLFVGSIAVSLFYPLVTLAMNIKG